MTGDTLIVRSGTYVENIEIMDKGITIKSELGPELTIIDGNQADRVVSIKNSMGQETVLDGFSITNGKHASGGAGILCRAAQCRIINNIVHGNHVEGDWQGEGGGISCRNYSQCTIENNIIKNNKVTVTLGLTSEGYGGGIYGDGDDVIRNNVIQENSVISALYAYGGGVYSYGLIEDNLITDNQLRAPKCTGGGIWCATSTVRNNTISENIAYATDTQSSSKSRGGGIYCHGAVVENNKILHNQTLKCGSLSVGADGIYTAGSSQILGNTIIGHPSPTNNQGLTIASVGAPIISGNHISNHDGSGIRCEPYISSKITIMNNTICDNYTGIGYTDGTLVIWNNIIMRNIGKRRL